MELSIEPAWRFIPDNPTIKDVQRALDALNTEIIEAQEALTRYEADPTEKSLAHLGEELADVATQVGTCFRMVESMPECHSACFTEHCLRWVYHKNYARGYLERNPYKAAKACSK